MKATFGSRLRRLAMHGLSPVALFAVAGGTTPGTPELRTVSSPTFNEPLVQGDSATVMLVVQAFHRALETGDSTGALALLANDVVIIEGGNVETKDRYRAGHLAADIRAARAVTSAYTPVRIVVRGELASVTSTSTRKGESNGRTINSAGAELMVLTKVAGMWKISAIHWSSRTARGG